MPRSLKMIFDHVEIVFELDCLDFLVFQFEKCIIVPAKPLSIPILDGPLLPIFNRDFGSYISKGKLKSFYLNYHVFRSYWSFNNGLGGNWFWIGLWKYDGPSNSLDVFLIRNNC